jgi:hypothetical protein
MFSLLRRLRRVLWRSGSGEERLREHGGTSFPVLSPLGAGQEEGNKTSRASSASEFVSSQSPYREGGREETSASSAPPTGRVGEFVSSSPSPKESEQEGNVPPIGSSEGKPASSSPAPERGQDRARSPFLPPAKGEQTRGPSAAGAFRPIPIGELLAEDLPPLSWIWEPFLPNGGLVVLAGDPKAGKSTLVCALALAVAQGRPFLGYPVKQTGVLILALEEHPRDVRRRLERLGARPGDRLAVHVGPVGRDPETRAAIARYIAEQGIGLVVVDTLTRFWSVEDENDNAQVARALEPLIELAHETNACILLVHHTRKNPGEGGTPGRDIRGASALLASVDQALVLSREGTRRRLDAVGRYAETPALVHYELVGNEFQRVDTGDAPASGHRRSAEVEDRVLAALGEDPLTVEELSNRTELDEKAVRNALKRLGPRVVREGRGVRGAPFRYRSAGQDATLPEGTPDRR